MREDTRPLELPPRRDGNAAGWVNGKILTLGLSYQGIAVACALLAHINGRGVAKVSIRRLEEVCKIARRSVIRAVRQLEECRVVTVERSHRAPSSYRFRQPIFWISCVFIGPLDTEMDENANCGHTATQNLPGGGNGTLSPIKTGALGTLQLKSNKEKDEGMTNNKSGKDGEDSQKRSSPSVSSPSLVAAANSGALIEDAFWQWLANVPVLGRAIGDPALISPTVRRAGKWLLSRAWEAPAWFREAQMEIEWWYAQPWHSARDERKRTLAALVHDFVGQVQLARHYRERAGVKIEPQDGLQMSLPGQASDFDEE